MIIFRVYKIVGHSHEGGCLQGWTAPLVGSCSHLTISSRMPSVLSFSVSPFSDHIFVLLFGGFWKLVFFFNLDIIREVWISSFHNF